MGRAKDLAKERINPAKELYKPLKDIPPRNGATQHLLYKSYRNPLSIFPKYPGKWSAHG